MTAEQLASADAVPTNLFATDVSMSLAEKTAVIQAVRDTFGPHLVQSIATDTALPSSMQQYVTAVTFVKGNLDDSTQPGVDTQCDNAHLGTYATESEYSSYCDTSDCPAQGATTTVMLCAARGDTLRYDSTISAEICEKHTAQPFAHTFDVFSVANDNSMAHIAIDQSVSSANSQMSSGNRLASDLLQNRADRVACPNDVSGNLHGVDPCAPLKPSHILENPGLIHPYDDPDECASSPTPYSDVLYTEAGGNTYAPIACSHGDASKKFNIITSADSSGNVLCLLHASVVSNGDTTPWNLAAGNPGTAIDLQDVVWYQTSRVKVGNAVVLVRASLLAHPKILFDAIQFTDSEGTFLSEAKTAINIPGSWYNLGYHHDGTSFAHSHTEHVGSVPCSGTSCEYEITMALQPRMVATHSTNQQLTSHPSTLMYLPPAPYYRRLTLATTEIGLDLDVTAQTSSVVAPVTITPINMGCFAKSSTDGTVTRGYHLDFKVEADIAITFRFDQHDFVSFTKNEGTPGAKDSVLVLPIATQFCDGSAQGGETSPGNCHTTLETPASGETHNHAFAGFVQLPLLFGDPGSSADACTVDNIPTDCITALAQFQDPTKIVEWSVRATVSHATNGMGAAFTTLTNCAVDGATACEVLTPSKIGELQSCGAAISAVEATFNIDVITELATSGGASLVTAGPDAAEAMCDRIDDSTGAMYPLCAASIEPQQFSGGTTCLPSFMHLALGCGGASDHSGVDNAAVSGVGSFYVAAAPLASAMPRVEDRVGHMVIPAAVYLERICGDDESNAVQFPLFGGFNDDFSEWYFDQDDLQFVGYEQPLAGMADYDINKVRGSILNERVKLTLNADDTFAKFTNDGINFPYATSTTWDVEAHRPWIARQHPHSAENPDGVNIFTIVGNDERRRAACEVQNSVLGSQNDANMAENTFPHTDIPTLSQPDGHASGYLTGNCDNVADRAGARVLIQTIPQHDFHGVDIDHNQGVSEEFDDGFQSFCGSQYDDSVSGGCPTGALPAGSCARFCAFQLHQGTEFANLQSIVGAPTLSVLGGMAVTVSSQDMHQCGSDVATKWRVGAMFMHIQGDVAIAVTSRRLQDNSTNGTPYKLLGMSTKTTTLDLGSNSNNNSSNSNNRRRAAESTSDDTEQSGSNDTAAPSGNTGAVVTTPTLTGMFCASPTPCNRDDCGFTYSCQCTGNEDNWFCSRVFDGLDTDDDDNSISVSVAGSAGTAVLIVAIAGCAAMAVLASVRRTEDEVKRGLQEYRSLRGDCPDKESA